MEDGTNRRLRRIPLVWLVLCGGALAGAVWWYYVRQRAALESSVSRQLAAIAEFKAKQIANWRSERLGDGDILSSEAVAALTRRVLSDGAAAGADRAALLDVLRRVVSASQYAGAVLVDQDGQPRLELNSAHDNRERYRALLTASSAGGASLSDVYLDRSGQPWMSLAVPVPGAGAIILGIDPTTFLYPYLQSWPTGSRSGETLLVRQEGGDMVYLSERKYGGGTALWRRKSLSKPSLPDDRAFRAGWAFKLTDYRGVPVMGVVHEVPGSDWYLIAKIDAAEVDEPVRRLGWEMALVIMLIVAASATGVGLIRRSQQLAMYREREAWFRQIANDTPAYLWTMSPTGENSFLNRQSARFLGTDQDRLDARWRAWLHPEDQERAATQFAKVLEARSEFSGEFRLRRFDGEYRWVLSYGAPRYGPGGEFAGYACASTDVTERRQAEQRLRDANAALAAELRERTRSEKEIHALTARLINAQEEERTRLARELHDDCSQQIATVSIATSILKKQIPPLAKDAIAQSCRIQEKLAHLAESVRRLSHELHPAVLQHSGLADALRSYCSEFAALTSHRIAFRVEGSCDAAPPAVALCVYRVAQEALQNSIKHSRVDQAEAVLTCRDGVLRLVVSDHGVGMDPDPVMGLGLVSIKERTRLVGGTVEVRSLPGEGFTLTLTIPIPAAEESQYFDSAAGR